MSAPPISTLYDANGNVIASSLLVSNVNNQGYGSSANVWTSNGGTTLPTWQAAAAEGALTWIASATASNSATVNFSNNLTSTYDNYLVLFEGVVAITNATTFRIRIGTGAGPTYQTTNYVGQKSLLHVGGASIVAIATAGAGDLSYDSDFSSTSTSAACGQIYIQNVNDATNYKNITSTMTYFSTVETAVCTTIGATQWQAATVLTSVQFLMASGNISTGIFKLYGIQN